MTKTNKAELLADLQNLGVKTGDNLFVHSSFKSLGEVDGGAAAVVEALLEALGRNGTLMFPAFTFYLLPEEAPVFDYAKSKSCVGYLSEYFRRHFAEGRSLHVSHSCSARGARAAEFLEHAANATPCGADTPLAKLLAAGGKVLMLGCSYNALTAIHVFEEKMQVPYVRFHGIPKAKLKKNGVYTKLKSQVVYPFQYDFTRLDAPFKEAGAVNQGKVAQSPSLLLDGAKMEAVTTALLKTNPLYLDNGN